MKTLLFLTINLEGMPLGNVLIVMVLATVLGGLMSLAYVLAHKKTVYDKTFTTTLFLLPVVVTVIIMLVADNIARAFSLAGVFTLVRFRTPITDSRDITYILAAVSIGIATALGYAAYAVMITVFMGIVFYVIFRANIERQNDNQAKLRIIIPENLNYSDVFNDIFKSYVASYQLQRVKTTDFGTMFELTYIIKMKSNIDQKAFIDELRVRNGNLSITLISDYASMISE
jgi:hypothetical protein